MAKKKATYDELQAYLARTRSNGQAADGAEAAVPAKKGGASRKPSARKRVLVVDDHEITRRLLFQLIQHTTDLEVVALAPDGATALRMMPEIRPDVAVVDFEMGEMSGLEVTRRIVAEFPETRVICLSMYDEDTAAPMMREAGAMAYVEKGASSEKLLGAIRACRVREDSRGKRS